MFLARGLRFRFTYLLLAIALVFALVQAVPGRASAADSPGAVYTISNAASGNEVVMYDRAADGSLSLHDSYPTGGAGTGASLGSQGALALTANGRWLFVVNAGSNTVSAFEVKADGLRLASTFPSGGVMPVSLTTRGALLYVLNAGGSGNIAGFAINGGTAAPIPGSVQPLSSSAAGAAQIQFDASGSVLVVTEKATSQIVTYTVDKTGAASAPNVYPSAGAVPFGFDIDAQNHLIVSEAVASSASSYQVGRGGSLSTLSGPVPNGQAAACWVVISKDGRFAFTANAGTSTISSYSVAPDGSIALMNGVAAATDLGPVDMSISNNGRFLYVINGRGDTIQGFRIGSDGSLSLVNSVTVPATAVGIAAR